MQGSANPALPIFYWLRLISFKRCWRYDYQNYTNSLHKKILKSSKPQIAKKPTLLTLLTPKQTQIAILSNSDHETNTYLARRFNPKQKRQCNDPPIQIKQGTSSVSYPEIKPGGTTKRAKDKRRTYKTAASYCVVMQITVYKIQILIQTPLTKATQYRQLIANTAKNFCHQ